MCFKSTEMLVHSMITLQCLARNLAEMVLADSLYMYLNVVTQKGSVGRLVEFETVEYSVHQMKMSNLHL